MKKGNLILVLLFISSITLFGQNIFTLSSKDLGGQMIKNQEFNGMGCSGKNQSPQLSWKNIPEGTKSFAVTMYDPDAPTGIGFWHWAVWDIPVKTNELPTNAGDVKLNLMPQGTIQGLTDYGTQGFGGVCPPVGHGIHQYIITVYALKTEKLGLDRNASPALIGFNLWANTIEKASIVAYYQR